MIRRLWLGLVGAEDRNSYRRLLAWAAGTALLATGHLDPWAWVALTGIYITGDSAERVARIAAGRP